MEPYAARITKLANLLKTWSNPIIFTGAGLSTNAGIPDYRSGMTTKSSTGPGIWNYKGDDSYWSRILESRRKTLIATPSYSHMAIAELVNHGYVDHLISQNVDGLHLKSGIPYHKLTELHGNLFMEKCEKCPAIYLRNYRTRVQEDRTHNTGRYWTQENWDGELHDTLVIFGESIPENKLRLCLYKAHHSELWITIGSSLMVKPAVSFPLIVKKKGKLAIANMEATPLDKIADVRFGGNWDLVMKGIMDELGISVPDYIQENSLQVLRNGNTIEFKPNNLNHSQIKHVELFLLNEKADMKTDEKPFKFKVNSNTDLCQARVYFDRDDKGPLEIDLNLSELSRETSNKIVAKFNSSQNEWSEINIVKE